ncbi:hypothetical protein VM98_29145 [Streptomyces rubellomurinus subsp. indigoferus]|nr:hypothetical protein VM98_29145 [Streptomyces rubellomurinus subsp. indigoferus]
MAAGPAMIASRRCPSRCTCATRSRTAPRPSARTTGTSRPGAADHRWRLRHGGGDTFRIQCADSGRVLGISGASTALGAQAVLWDDNGAGDHLWRFI